MNTTSLLYGIAFILLAVASFMQWKCYPSGGWAFINLIFVVLFVALGLYNLYIGFSRNDGPCF